MKEAIVYQNERGYWIIEDAKTNQKISEPQRTELEAYKVANFNGYIVR